MPTQWGEALPLLLQNLVLVHMILHFRSHVGAVGAATGWAVVAGLLYAGFAGMIPMALIAGVQRFLILNVVLGKAPQIWLNFTSKSTGQLSLVTSALFMVGAMARVFTTLTETSDMVTLVNFALSATLNAVIVAQILMYGGATKDKAELKKAKRNPRRSGRKVD